MSALPPFVLAIIELCDPPIAPAGRSPSQDSAS